MKNIILVVVIGCITFATATSASMRLDGGRVLIKSGTPVSELTRHLGYPSHRTRSVVCTKQRSHSRCDEWSAQEVWQYYHDNRNWRITVQDGTIQDMEWSR